MRPELEDVLNRARSLGFLGPGSIRVQADHAMTYTPWLPESGRVADLGSGGGLPGLVLATVRPDLDWELIDSNQRRVAHLRWAVGHLDFGDRVGVTLGRAEELARGGMRGSFDAVVSRSFGPRSSVCECGAPLLRLGGRILISEPPARRKWGSDALAKLGLKAEEDEVGTPIAVLIKVGSTPDSYPRSWREQQKRPLF